MSNILELKKKIEEAIGLEEKHRIEKKLSSYGFKKIMTERWCLDIHNIVTIFANLSDNGIDFSANISFPKKYSISNAFISPRRYPLSDVEEGAKEMEECVTDYVNKLIKEKNEK